MTVRLKQMVLITAIFLLGGCAVPLVQYEKKSEVLSLKMDKKQRYNVALDKPVYQPLRGQCLKSSYMITDSNHPRYGYLFATHISLKGGCQWKGLLEGYFINAAKKGLKATEIKKIGGEEIGQYKFIRYSAKIEGKREGFYIINLWGAGENTFIIDRKGELTREIKQRLRNLQ